MSNTFTQRQRASKREARLRWLRANPGLLARLPGASDDVDESQSAALGEAYEHLTAEGLYSVTSEKRATRWGIRLLVSDLRGQHVSGKDQRYRS